MHAKIIDFNSSKLKLIQKKFQDVKMFEYDEFEKVYNRFKNSLVDIDNSDEITLNEVLDSFNKYFDSLYKKIVSFDDKKIPMLKEMIDYSMLSNGKRLRPFLMYVSYKFFGGANPECLFAFMVAIELIHTFSLIHDDLPCMDNDELRRGRPTVWKKYGEDMGVLVGDALILEASTLLIEAIMELSYSPYSPLVMTSALVLLKLSGFDGMITGQVFDVMNENNDLSENDILYMYDKKTSALLTAAITIGANMTGSISDKITKIDEMCMCIGEAYQIKDDLLEIESTTEKIGKSTKSDENNNKQTYVKKVGVDKAKKYAIDLTNRALQIIDDMSTNANYKDTLAFKKIIGYLLCREK